MFLARKFSPVKERDTVSILSSPETGAVLNFGFLPQKNLSGRRLAVGEPRRYELAGESFVSYRLLGTERELRVVLLPATGEEPACLALSLSLDARLWPRLFATHPPARWHELETGRRLAPARFRSALKGWLAPSYTLAWKGEGRTQAADTPAESDPRARGFRYTLWSDGSNAHALESEEYEGGIRCVFATVYRPVTDVEIRKSCAGNGPGLALIPPALTPELLACDGPLAGRVLAEAERNRMPLATLVRKVIGLPEVWREEVFIPLNLTDEEYGLLARRYAVAPADRQIIRAHIVGELRQFVGKT